MKVKDKVISIIFALALLCSLLYLIRSVLTPFVLSLVIAYFLDPLVDSMCKKYKLSRTVATSIILGLFLTTVTTACYILLPIIFVQLSELLNAIPGYLQTAVTSIYPKLITASEKFGFKLDADMSHLLENEKITSYFVDFSQNILGNAISSSVALINILSLVFVTPILVFYLLKDWKILITKINDYLPRSISLSVKKIASDVDKTLSGYIRGQINVCIILGLIYSTLLSFTGLNFGFLIGFLTGIFSFIPYVGASCGIAVALIVAIFQWGFDGANIAGVVLVFIFGQTIESNFLTPKLIGEKIGLHPVWLIFGLFTFGALFGFIGVLVAVPLTAIFSVIIKHFAIEYKKRFT